LNYRKTSDRPNYVVRVEPEGDWLLVQVELPNRTYVTQAVDLGEVEAQARSLISLMLEVPEPSFDITIQA